jgi:hypothetical protein
MANRDGSNDKKIVWAKTPTAISTDTTTASNIIDTQGYDKVTFVIIASAYTDGTYTPAVSESDDSGMSGENAVADADLTRLETAAAVSAATTNSTDASKKIGYLGSKRYVTCDIVSTSTSSGATVGVMAILENANVQPV